MSACEGRPVKVEFPALWEPTERECAETEQIRTNRLERLWSMGVASDAEIRRSLNEHEPIEDLLVGPPTAEPTRAVTQIAVTPPGQNPAAPIDPDAPDEPAPPKVASPFPAAR